MKLIKIILYILFIGYKNISMAFWLMFPIIILFCATEEPIDYYFHSEYFMPVWIIGMLVFYALYSLLVRQMMKWKI